MNQDDVPTIQPEGGQDAPERLPDLIGRYKIVSVLGRGGMGIVYEAEQSHPHRSVALKVILGGSYVDDLHIRLFEREVDTLARLKHPNIATIYEAGRTEEGQHFFAMELVRGTTLGRYVAERQLSRRDRLELFCTICGAINHAHQRGVIHRDLKPSNILVDSDGEPKVLDFGLARITDWDLNTTTMLTRPGNIVGTLTHMSPEQARGDVDEIDVRSDVYALGVILYQLMTDRLPFEWDQRSLPAGLTAILERDPPKPSSVDRRLRGDLDTIIMKSLEKDPARRYQSAAAFGDDVERFLTNQPILARPTGTFYQFRKLVARHKLPFALLAAILVIAIGFGIWTRALYLAERQQHTVATDNLETATFVSDFLVDMFDVSDPDAGRRDDITARELLENAADKIDEQEGRPEVQIDLMLTMGRVYRRLGDYDRALELFEDARRVSETIDPEHPKVAESLQEMGWVRKSRGDYEAAEAHLRQSIDLRRRSLGDPYPGLSTDLLLLSGTLLSLGDYDSAEALAREALALGSAAAEPDEIEISRVLGKLGSIRMALGDHAEAESLFREVLEIRRRLQGEDHPWVSDAMTSLAAVMQYGGNYEEAVDLAGQALAIRRRSHGDDHPYTGSNLVWQGMFLRDRGKYDEAEPVLREALRVYENLPPGHAYLASGLTQLGWLLFDTGRLDEAEESFDEALRIYRNALRDGHTNLGQPMLGLGRVHLARGNAVRAEPLLRAVLELYVGNLPEGHWQTASVESALGACLTRLDRCDEAGPLVRHGHQAMQKLRGANDRYVAEASAFVEEFEQRCEPNSR